MIVPESIRRDFDQNLADEQASMIEKINDLRLDFDSGGVQAAIARSASGYAYYRIDQKPVHSRHDPISEAARHLSRISIRDDNQVILFFGAGLGYVIRLFLNERTNRCIWFESDPNLLYAALGLNDFRDVLNDRLSVRTILPDEKFLEERLAKFRNQEIEFYVQDSTFSGNPFYGAAKKIIERYLNKKSVNLATMTRFDRNWTSNIIKNFYHLARAKPVSLLFDRFRDVTALICGAGPSLGDSVDQIREYRDRFLLIAVDTALIPLTAAGIDPDITVTVDPQPLNRNYIEGYEGKSLFVCDPTTSYLSLRLLPEDRLYFYRSPFRISELFFRHLRVSAGDIAFGGSVSTNAYDLAIKLGCRNILLVGQDLSFSNGLAHVKGAVLEEALSLKESRLFRRELHNHRQLHALPVRLLPSIDGTQSVPTNDKLKIFYEWFNSRFYADCRSGVSIVNCTKSGARFEHVRHAGLEICAEFPIAEEPPTEQLFHLHASLSDKSYFDDIAFAIELNTLIAQLESIIQDLENAESMARRMLELVGGPDPAGDHEVGAIILRLEGVDERLRSKPDLSELISGIMQRAISLIDTDDPDSLDRAGAKRLMAKKNAVLYSELRRGCSDYLRWLRHTKRMFESRSS